MPNWDEMAPLGLECDEPRDDYEEALMEKERCCKYCGEGGLYWRRIDGRMVLASYGGVVHHCRVSHKITEVNRD